MDLTYILIVVVVLAMLYNFRKAIMALAPLQFLLVMFAFPKMPVSPFEIISFLVICMFFATTGSNEWKRLFKYPFRFCVFMTIVSVVGTNYFVAPHWPTASLRFMSAYIFPVILWSCVKDRDDFYFLIKCMTIFTGIMGIYILLEAALGKNPFIENLIASKLANDNVINYTEIRFGMKRCQGFLSTPASSGLVLGIYAVVLYIVSPVMGYYKKYTPILVGLLGLCTLLSGTRSVIAAACVAWLIIAAKEAFTPKYFILKIIIVMCLLAAAGTYLVDIFESFVDTEKVQGSNSDMRMNQLMIALLYWANSPIWGNGSGFIWDFVKEVDEEIYGAESVWFQLLIDMGLVGAVAYLSCVFNVIKTICKKHKMWMFVPLAFLTGKTLTSVLGIEISLLFVFGIILLKYQELYEDDGENGTEKDSEENADSNVNHIELDC